MGIIGMSISPLKPFPISGTDLPATDRYAGDRALLRLLHLSSAGLPVGAYAFSHGLEYAIESGWLKHVDDIHNWLAMQLHHSLACVDLPILLRLMAALESADQAAINYWNDFALACRETRELQLTDTAPGEALQRLLPEFGIAALPFTAPVSFITGFAQAGNHWQLGNKTSALGYSWSWLENQVNAATKLLPLGQTQAQRLLSALQEEVPDAISYAFSLKDEQLGASLPALAIASMLHETQYTRLFRS